MTATPVSGAPPAADRTVPLTALPATSAKSTFGVIEPTVTPTGVPVVGAGHEAPQLIPLKIWLSWPDPDGGEAFT